MQFYLINRLLYNAYWILHTSSCSEMQRKGNMDIIIVILYLFIIEIKNFWTVSLCFGGRKVKRVRESSSKGGGGWEGAVEDREKSSCHGLLHAACKTSAYGTRQVSKNLPCHVHRQEG